MPFYSQLFNPPTRFGHSVPGLDELAIGIGALLVMLTSTLAGAYSAKSSAIDSRKPLDWLDTGITVGIAYFIGFWAIITINSWLKLDVPLAARLQNLELWINVITLNCDEMGWVFLALLIAAIIFATAGTVLYIITGELRPASPIHK